MIFNIITVSVVVFVWLRFVVGEQKQFTYANKTFRSLAATRQDNPHEIRLRQKPTMPPGGGQPAKHRRQTFLGLCDWFFYVESRRSPPSASAEGHLGPGLFDVCSTTLYNSTASREPLSLRSTIKPGLDLWLWSFQGRIGHKNTQKTSHHHFSNSSQRTATRDSLSSSSPLPFLGRQTWNLYILPPRIIWMIIFNSNHIPEKTDSRGEIHNQSMLMIASWTQINREEDH